MDAPTYTGKPTAYLDHNILDLLIKSPNNDFFPQLLENYQVVYSDETLSEIKRTGERGELFLDLLERLSAIHIRILLNDCFDVTDTAILNSTHPRIIYAQFLENSEKVFESLIKSTSQSLLKFYGGRDGASLEEISAEQTESFFSLLDDLTKKAEEIEELNPELYKTILVYAENFKSQFVAVQGESLREMRKHVSTSSVPSVQAYRDTTGLGPKQLNNIEPPYVIEQIWELHKHAPGYADQNFTIEQFLGISKAHFQPREMYQHEKVRICYNTLNVVGYHQDSKLKVERRLTAALSDAGHASIASFTNYVFSRDQAFIRKARAVYEFLNVATIVKEVVINEQST